MGAELGNAPTGRDDASSILDYVEIVRRRIRVVLAVLVIVPLVAAVASLGQSPLYSATASDLFNGQGLAASLSGSADPSAAQDPARVLQTQASIAAAVPVAQLALGLANIRTLTPLELLGRCGVAAQSDANLLGFTCTDGTAARARLLADAYARAFIDYRRKLDTSALENARANYARRIKELERRGQTNTQLYASFVDREQQLATQLALQSSNVSLARAATSATKVRPRPLRNGVLGLGLGVMLAIGLAFLLDAVDTRIRSTRELERRLGLPLLARIPEPPRWAARRRHLVMVADPNGDDSEAFRVLRTNLEFFNMEHGARTIMITSAVAEEGKSTTVANLAVALSRAGRRVVLVDLDLRRPTLDSFFNFEGRPGLTDVVLGRARLSDADPPNAEGGSLEVLTTGPLPRDTGEFVAGQALSNVLEELRSRADVVLIDSPPLLAVGDTITLAGKVDAIVVLTRLGIARRKTIEELRRVLGNCPGAKLGFVVTGAELDTDHRYGEGYGYGYGGSSYAHNAAKERRR
jgi:receptor protein-tyrosine kinase